MMDLMLSLSSFSIKRFKRSIQISSFSSWALNTTGYQYMVRKKILALNNKALDFSLNAWNPASGRQLSKKQGVTTSDKKLPTTLPHTFFIFISLLQYQLHLPSQLLLKTGSLLLCLYYPTPKNSQGKKQTKTSHSQLQWKTS